MYTRVGSQAVFLNVIVKLQTNVILLYCARVYGKRQTLILFFKFLHILPFIHAPETSLRSDRRSSHHLSAVINMGYWQSPSGSYE